MFDAPGAEIAPNELTDAERRLGGIPDAARDDDVSPVEAERLARRHVLHVSFIAAFGGLLYGYDTGVISGAMLHVTEEFHINEERFGSAAHNITEIITSSILLGAVLGALGTSVIVKKVGRRKAIIGIAAVFAIGVLLSGAANDWWTLSLARVFLGLAVGGSTMAIPTYISELAPPAKRGSYVTFFNVAIGVGILTASLVNYFRDSAISWRVRIAAAVVPALVLLIGMKPLPESPRWLVQQGFVNPARRVLRWVRPSTRAVDAEIAEIKRTYREEQQASGEGEWRTLFSEKWIRPALFAGIMVAIFTQITGLEMMIYYTPTILKNNVGFSDDMAQAGNVGVGVVYLVMTTLGKFVVDRIGRRRLMLVMLPGAAVSIAAFGIAFWVTNDDPPAGVALALILSFMFFQAGGIQVVGWLMGSELYPLKVRSAATALHAAALWGSNLLITLTALTLIDWLSLPGAMIFYAVINVIAWVTVYFFVPETKGRSLEEIESSLQDGTFLPHRGRKRSPADA